jgi:hypothetical protein
LPISASEPAVIRGRSQRSQIRDQLVELGDVPVPLRLGGRAIGELDREAVVVRAAERIGPLHQLRVGERVRVRAGRRSGAATSSHEQGGRKRGHEREMSVDDHAIIEPRPAPYGVGEIPRSRA